MNARSKIPQHLAPYVENVPQDALVLVTGTLSNTANWLIVRYLCAALSNVGGNKNEAKNPSNPPNGDPTDDGDEVGVVLVSWMRDLEFWKTEVRRASGIDLATCTQKKRFAFVDGLSSTIAPSMQQKPVPLPPMQPVSRPSSTLPARAPPTTTPVRGPPRPEARSQPAETRQTLPASIPSTSVQKSSPAGTDLASIRKAIDSAIASISASRVLLVLDSIHLLLLLSQSTSPSASTAMASALQSWLMSLRIYPRVYLTVVSLASDINPLPSHQHEQQSFTPLEIDSQALLVGLAHSSDLVLSVRGLDTGAAGDVGGVVRVTKGPSCDVEFEVARNQWKEQELLYLVKTDGNTKVWERGAGVGVG